MERIGESAFLLGSALQDFEAAALGFGFACGFQFIRLNQYLLRASEPVVNVGYTIAQRKEILFGRIQTLACRLARFLASPDSASALPQKDQSPRMGINIFDYHARGLHVSLCFVLHRPNVWH